MAKTKAILEIGEGPPVLLLNRRDKPELIY